jgi:hypothetical protein
MADKDKYKFYGSKKQGTRVDRVQVGDTVLEVGGESQELSESQAEALKARGLDVRKTGGGSRTTEQEDQSE